ncbi:MAG: SGNH/GDSL hydrolase family protein [Rubrivivax sp.]
MARMQAGIAGLGVTVRNLAIGGTTTYDGLATGTPLVAGRPAPNTGGNVTAALAYAPKLIIVAYPTNDTANGYSVAEQVQNILAIRATAAANGAAVLVQGTQPRNLSDAQRALLAQVDASLASSIGACFVEVRSAVAAADGRIAAAYDAGDGVHLNDAGHALIYARIKAVLDGGNCVKVR